MAEKPPPKPRPGKPFVKGDPRAGRPKGVQNKATIEAKAFCTGLVKDPAYQKNLKKRMRNGTVPPAVETMVWYYAAGKPKERVELGADKSLAQLVKEAIEGEPDEENNE